MQTTGYVSWKPPVLVKGKYEVKIVFAESFVGTKVDDNGEVSVGMSFQYEVTGPADAVMSDGSSAVGYRFKELMLEPKRNSSMKYINMCNAKWHSQFDACFGDNVPENVEPEEFFDRCFLITAYPKWDEYSQEDQPNISWRGRLV